MSATATGIGITRLGQIAVNAKDVERAAAFYEEKVGLKLLFKALPRSRSSIIPVRFCISPCRIFRRHTAS